MAVIKCKMCGGDIEFTPGDTYGTCEYCGSTSTIPRAEDEQKLNRYNRANHFRRQCEFDKAVAAYEKILEQDDSDAEAHWGAVLSRYGIEYVEDPATGRRIPTCHRVQVASILADADYQAALDNAPDYESRRLYEAQAAEIADIQRGILAISANEKPYDVFICYKETDETGRRTRDSQWAQDVYYGLTDAGYKVFFSRITLEDKLGQQYEPYIFAALNSAKVMVVIGSKPEYFNAVWVKNEWSRYLSLMTKDRKRLLIPCYRDMDPYDLPEELSTLQSQDMSKIGFMQDLLRGVKKVLEAEKAPTETRVVRETVQSNAQTDSKVNALLERGNMALEDGEWDKALNFFEEVLNTDAKNAQAYLGEALVQEQCRSLDAFIQKRKSLSQNVNGETLSLKPAQAHINEMVQQYYIPNYVSGAALRDLYQYALSYRSDVSERQQQLDREKEYWANHRLLSRAEKFAEGSTKEELNGQKQALFAVLQERVNKAKEEETRTVTALQAAYARHIQSADERAQAIYEQGEKKREADYLRLKDIAKTSSEPGQLIQTESELKELNGYKDSSALAQYCATHAKEIQAEQLYKEAKKAMEEAGDSSQLWRYALNRLAAPSLNTYRDVPQLRKQAEERFNHCKQAEQQAAKEAQELLARQAAARAKKKKTITIISAAAVAVLIAAFLLITQVIIPAVNYNKAETLRAEGQYEEAVAIFTELDDYKDSNTQIYATYYAQGESLRNAEKWDEAIKAFTNAKEYSDAKTQSSKTRYMKAEAEYAAGNLEDAASIFTSIPSYNDAKERAGKIYYELGEARRKEKDWDGARKAFKQAGSYDDAGKQVYKTYYMEGEYNRDKQNWSEAIEAFQRASNYNGADEQVLKTYYMKGEASRSTKNWEVAVACFTNAGSYGDAATQVKETRYQQGKYLMEKKNYSEAITIFTDIKGYKDVNELLKNDALVTAWKKTFSVGKYVTFGTYPQTAEGTDKTPIEWLVLEKQGDKALLLSKYGLDVQPYNTKQEATTWEKCTLRTWLNRTFYNKAFTPEEQKRILTTSVSNANSQGYGGWTTKGGKDTKDRVFLLSYAEANKYLGVAYDNFNNIKARVSPTAYAVAQGVLTWDSYTTQEGKAAAWWFLRSPGIFQSREAFVNYDGSLPRSTVNNADKCVRPAIWVDLSSGAF